MFLGGSSSVFTWCIDQQKPISLADKAYLFCSAWSWQDEVHWRDGFQPLHPSSGKTTSRGRRLGCFLSAGAAKHLLLVGPSVDSKRPPPHWNYSLSHLSHTGFCSGPVDREQMTDETRGSHSLPERRWKQHGVQIKHWQFLLWLAVLVESDRRWERNVPREDDWLEKGSSQDERGSALGLNNSPATLEVPESMEKLVLAFLFFNLMFSAFNIRCFLHFHLIKWANCKYITLLYTTLFQFCFYKFTFEDHLFGHAVIL